MSVDDLTQEQKIQAVKEIILMSKHFVNEGFSIACKGLIGGLKEFEKMGMEKMTIPGVIRMVGQVEKAYLRDMEQDNEDITKSKHFKDFVESLGKHKQ